MINWEITAYDRCLQKSCGAYKLPLQFARFNGLQLTQSTTPSLETYSYFNISTHLTDATDPAHTPFSQLADASLDFIALPHTLEISPSPIEILRAAKQKLKPSGHLMLTIFNLPPKTIEYLHQQFPFWERQPVYQVARTELLTALYAQGMRPVNAGFACYQPRLCVKYVDFRALELIGDRWLPHLGQIFWADLVPSKSLHRGLSS
ncbi:MAG: hypothetical protein QM520_01705 [Gammaproteobacteria bacterium]|nr:hypothetical protein [Gammaproteobacteria bacterium]